MEPAEQSEQSDRMESSKMTEQTEHMEQMEKTIRLNDKLTLTFPEGFHVMDDEEKKTLRFLENGPGEALADPEHHIIVTIGWKSVGGLASLLLKARDAAKASENNVRKAMESLGYQSEGFGTRQAGPLKAENFGYTYEAQGTGMYGETCCVKQGRTFYYFNCYIREAARQEGLKIWEGILASAGWTD